MMVERQLLVIGFLLSQTNKHEWCEIDRYPSQDYNRKNSGSEKRHHYPFYCFFDETQFLLQSSKFQIQN
jgi:hypothetical protein